MENKKIDRSNEIICDFAGSLVSKDSDAYHTVRQLEGEDDFRKKLFDLRDQLGIKNVFSGSIEERLDRFVKSYEAWNPEDKRLFDLEILAMVSKYNLPFGWTATLRYLIGCGMIISPTPQFFVWKNPEEKTLYTSIPSINIMVGEQYSQDELCALIRKNWQAVKSKMAALPKKRRWIIHKDSSGDLGATISYFRDAHHLSFSKIADLLQEISAEDPKQFRGKVIELSDSEVRAYYSKHKQSLKFKRTSNATKTP